MSKRLVFDGKRFAFVEAGETPAPAIGEQPRRPQKAACKSRGMPYRLRDFRPLTDGGNGYRPGPLVELGADQCRFTIGDGVMCGAQGYPWCDHHRAVCFTGPWKPSRRKEAA